MVNTVSDESWEHKTFKHNEHTKVTCHQPLPVNKFISVNCEMSWRFIKRMVCLCCDLRGQQLSGGRYEMSHKKWAVRQSPSRVTSPLLPPSLFGFGREAHPNPISEQATDRHTQKLSQLFYCLRDRLLNAILVPCIPSPPFLNCRFH